MRTLYAERRTLLAQALMRVLGNSIRVDLPSGGMHLVMLFNAPVDDFAVADRAREAGLAVLALSEWYLGGRTKRSLRGLVLGFANVADSAEATRLARLLLRAFKG